MSRHALYPLLLGLILVLQHTGVRGQGCAVITLTQESDGFYSADFSEQSEIPFLGLEVLFTFDLPVTSVTNLDGMEELLDATHVRMYNDTQFVETGMFVDISFEVTYSGTTKPEVVAIDMNSQDACDGSLSWTTDAPYTLQCQPTGMTPYDYSQALCMSFLFYEAERSGVLPADQRVTPWRWDSALGDGSDVGHDLTGGYYDAGDHVKFGFPMAVTATMLSWGLIDFAEGYEAAGQAEYGRAAVKWATDYFLKAHTAEYELYGQVGDGAIDHVYWGRPEDMVMPRPAWKIDRENPGTELACETAAALAAASIVFKDVDPAYSTEMLEVAQELYAFGDEYRLEYHLSIPNVQDFYRSWSGYGDELVWGALWLYRATGNSTYLAKAQAAWDEFDQGTGSEEFSWDDKRGGAYALGSMLEPSNPMYETALTEFLRHIREDKPYTPGGLVFIDMWGSNRHAANVAFLHLWAAKYGDPAVADSYRLWAESQINFILGDVGHSFLVGFGLDPPERPHHRGSMCPIPPASCTEDLWGYMQPGPNPHILYGAIVGGPAEDGFYEDDRQDYVHNEVACDYNAAYTGVLAAMVENN